MGASGSSDPRMAGRGVRRGASIINLIAVDAPRSRRGGGRVTVCGPPKSENRRGKPRHEHQAPIEDHPRCSTERLDRCAEPGRSRKSVDGTGRIRPRADWDWADASSSPQDRQRPPQTRATQLTEGLQSPHSAHAAQRPFFRGLAETGVAWPKLAIPRFAKAPICPFVSGRRRLLTPVTWSRLKCGQG